MRADRIMSGWCETDHHERCSHLIREGRVTPKGAELCELWCCCKCHKEFERDRRVYRPSDPPIVKNPLHKEASHVR